MAYLDDLMGGVIPTLGRGSLVNFNAAGLGDAIGSNRNALVGLGLGLMQPGGNPWGTAMAGFQAGANSDQLNAYRMQLLKDRAEDNRFKEREAARAQGNADRAHKFQVEQADRPQIHWPKATEDEDGNPVQPPPQLFFPRSGVIKQLDAATAQRMSQQLPSTGGAFPQETYAQGGPLAAATPAEDSSIPPNAQLAQAGGTEVVSPSVKYRGPQKYRDKANAEQAQADVAARARTETAKGMMGVIDSLEKKIQSPEFKAISAANPMAGAASEGDPLYNPARWAYEMVGNTKNKDMIDQIRQDANALNLEFSQLYYKGQGAVSNMERENVAKLVGQIQQARSPESAMALTRNLRSIVQNAIQKVPGYNVPTGGSGPSLSPENSNGGWSIKRLD